MEKKKKAKFLCISKTEKIYTYCFYYFLKKGKVLVASREENWVLEDTVKGKGLLDVGEVPSKLGGTKTTEVMVSNKYKLCQKCQHRKIPNNCYGTGLESNSPNRNKKTESSRKGPMNLIGLIR